MKKSDEKKMEALNMDVLDEVTGGNGQDIIAVVAARPEDYLVVPPGQTIPSDIPRPMFDPALHSEEAMREAYERAKKLMEEEQSGRR